MKILAISQYPLEASTTNRILGFAIGLRKLGHDVTLLIIGNHYLPGAHKTPLPREIQGVRIQQTPSVPDSWVVMPGFVSGILALLFMFFIKAPLAFFAARRHDVLYASKPLPYGAIVALVASRLARKPLVLDTDDWEGVGGFATVKQGKRALVKAVITYFEEKMPLWSKATVAASNLLAQRVRLTGVPADSVFVAQNGADLQKFHPALDGSAVRQRFHLSGTIFSYLGTFKKGGANWEMLLDAFAHCARKTSDSMLLVIGFGEQLQDAQAYAETLGLSQRVVFAGRVEHADVPSYLAAADVCLLPYETAFPHTFINIGRSSVKLYEYMAMGKPVIGSDIGEIHTALQDGAGLLVGQESAEAFGTAMAQLVLDPHLLETLGQGARQRAETVFNYDSMATVVEKALRYATKSV